MKNIFDEVRIIHLNYDDSIRIEFVFNHKSLLNALRYGNKFNKTWCSDDNQVFVPLNAKDFLNALTKTNTAALNCNHYYKGCLLSMNPKTHRIPYVKYEKIEVDKLILLACEKFDKDFQIEEQKTEFIKLCKNIASDKTNNSQLER